MNTTNPFVTTVRNKLLEQIERTQHLIALIPPDKLEWRPTDDAFCLGEVLGHLLECVAGFCAVLYAVQPDKLSHLASLRELRVNHHCPADEASERLHLYQNHIEEGFAILRDEDLAHRIATVFVSEGETVLTLLLGNLEHLINHKYQLFFYLKLLAIQVSSADLYRFRGDSVNPHPPGVP